MERASEREGGGGSGRHGVREIQRKRAVSERERGVTSGLSLRLTVLADLPTGCSRRLLLHEYNVYLK